METKVLLVLRVQGLLMAFMLVLLMSPLAAGQRMVGPAPQNNTVAVTPIGQRTGELCNLDRALLFQDPTGVRILYDPGATVTGADDPRLGAVDVILLSHAHFDHLGVRRLNQDPDDPNSTCDRVPPVTFSPYTTTAEIAAAKNSAVLVGLGLELFLKTKISKLNTAEDCYGADVQGPINELIVPRGRPCTAHLGPGTYRIVTRVSGTPGVRITQVPAQHVDNIRQAMLLTEPLSEYMADNQLTIYTGQAHGYVLTFSNGLRVYLSGDTGPSAEMAITRDLYHPNLAVLNIDSINTLGPEEAAFTVMQLIMPAAVIPSHAGQAVTKDGELLPDTRIAQFISMVPHTPVYLPLSGRTMQFSGEGLCTSGCGEANAASRGK